MTGTWSRKRNRIRWPLPLAGALIFAAIGAVYLHMRDPQLLERAHRVGKVADAYYSITLTDHSVLLLRGNGHPPGRDFGWNVLVQDFRTSATVERPDLSQWYDAASNPYGSLHLHPSPDVRLLLFWEDSEHRSDGAVVSMDTGRVLLRLTGRESRDPCWSSDGALYSFPAPASRTVPVVRYRFTDSGADAREAVPHSCAPAEPPTDVPRCLSARGWTGPRASARFGGRVAWVCSLQSPDTAPTWLPSWLRDRIYKPGHELVGIWISRADGSDCRAVGLTDVGGEIEDGSNIPSDLRWTPDGKRLTFIVDGALWTVPAD